MYKFSSYTFGASAAIALNVQVLLLQRPHHPSSPFPSDCTRLATFIRDQNHQNTPTSVLSSKLSQFFDTFSRLTQILYICRIYQLSSERRDVTNFNFFHFQVHHTTPSTPQYTLVHPSLLKNERWQKHWSVLCSWKNVALKVRWGESSWVGPRASCRISAHVSSEIFHGDRKIGFLQSQDWIFAIHHVYLLSHIA